MPQTYLVGNDGAVTISVGGTTHDIIKVQTFSLNLSRPSLNLTGFNDTGGRRRLGMLDATGTLNGVAGVNVTGSTNTSSSFFHSTFSDAATNTTNSPAELTLTLYDGSSTSDAKLVAKTVLYNFAFNSNKQGDSTVSCNFENADGVAPVLTWLV